MSDDILTVKTVKQVRSIRGSALVHIIKDHHIEGQLQRTTFISDV